MRIKLGAHEFEAEGPPELIAAHFGTWRSMVAALGGPEADAAARAAGPQAADPLAAFAVDAERKLVALRRYPTGKAPDADALLLLLYGFARALGQNPVVVPRLQAALAASGRQGARIYRVLEAYRDAGLVRKSGRRRGTKYQLTPAGIQRAAALAQADARRPQPA